MLDKENIGQVREAIRNREDFFFGADVKGRRVMVETWKFSPLAGEYATALDIKRAAVYRNDSKRAAS